MTDNNIITTARQMYNEYSGSHPTIHCNRFPSWNELSADYKNEWYAKAVTELMKSCTCPSGNGSLRWPCPIHPPVEVELVPLPESDCQPNQHRWLFNVSDRARIQDYARACVTNAIAELNVELVGEAMAFPGSNGGFTMATFNASEVPLGTKLYIQIPAQKE